MAGIEPASERIDPRISTSVFGWFFSLASDQPTKRKTSQPFGLLTLFHVPHGKVHGIPTFMTPWLNPAGQTDPGGAASLMETN